MSCRTLPKWQAVGVACGLVASLAVVSACSDATESTTRFTLLTDSVAIGAFVNRVDYTEQVNPYTFKSFYNGGGVGIGDLDGDGRLDVVLTGNMVDNAVYYNRGDWRFEPAPPGHDLAGAGAWTTGVTLADVNGDGLLDAYLSKSGPPSELNRRNELRINRGGGRFEDVAAAAGVDDLGLSVHAAFFDYDRDGDLDLYLLNNSLRSVGNFDLRPGAREVPDTAGGNKLYRNLLAETDELRFEDVTAEAGIYSSEIGFGLGVSVGDVNGDLWPDLYVSNDFFERDYLYINQGDGRFAERLEAWAPETAMGAMGADVADLNGDGYPEVVVTEMLPRDARRYRSKAQFEDYNKRRVAERAGYHRQYGRNALLVNRGGRGFAELSRQAGVDATDWSWGALLADLDNDGRRDIFIANGIYKDLLDQDYVNFTAADANVRDWIKAGGEVVKRLIDSMPSEAVGNYAFANRGELVFADSSAAWGLDVPSFSNGSAYGDLDGDGDLDLVVNQLNGPALVYRNDTRERAGEQANYLRVALVDTVARANRAAWGSRITAYTPAGTQTAEIAPVRGFMSSVEPVAHFGLGDAKTVDSLRVEWSGGGAQTVLTPLTNSTTVVTRTARSALTPAVAPLRPATRHVDTLAFTHEESPYNDFDRYPFLPEMISAEGPALAVHDDGERSLIFVGGAAGQSGALFGLTDTGFRRLNAVALAGDRSAEDVAAAFADVDADGLVDLVVASGSDEQLTAVTRLRPRLYRQVSPGTFALDYGAFLAASSDLAAGALTAADFDGDGDVDLFYGTHFLEGQYGRAAPSYFLVNDGSGAFSVTRQSALDTLARVRAAVVCELDGTPGPELAVAREYGSVIAYDISERLEVRELARSATGLWRALGTLDVNGDGIDELLAGNLGLNSRLRSTPSATLTLNLVSVPDRNSLLPVVSGPVGGKEIVLAQRKAFAQKVPALARRFPRYAPYAETDARELLSEFELRAAYSATELRSGVLSFDGSTQTLRFEALPSEAQRSSVRAIASWEVGGQTWAVLAGNYDYVQPEFGGQLSGVGSAWRYRDGEWIRGLVDLELGGQVRGLARVNGRLAAAQNNGELLLIGKQSD